MRKLVISRQRRNGTWAVELKIPKCSDKVKQAISLRAVPENLNESEADAMCKALADLEWEKRPLKGKPTRVKKTKKQMSLPHIHDRVPTRPFLKPETWPPIAVPLTAEQIKAVAVEVQKALIKMEPIGDKHGSS